MGIQKQTVQKILFQSLDTNKLGINIVPNDTDMHFDLTVTDNMLYTCTACMIPIATANLASKSLHQYTDEQLLNHIVKHVCRTYIAMATKCKILILCDDGCSTFKPAVRAMREKAKQTSAMSYLRENKIVVRNAIFDTLTDNSIPFVYMCGRHSEGAGGEIIIGPQTTADNLQLQKFSQTLQSKESDTLMFEFVLFLRARAQYGGTIGIITKDTDIVPTAMTILHMRRADCLGATTLGFCNPIFTITGPIKDFDVAVDQYGWNSYLCPPYRSPDDLTWTVSNSLVIPANIWDYMYDCANAKVVFDYGISTLLAMLTTRCQLRDFLATLHIFSKQGIRGPSFRRLVTWLTYMDDPVIIASTQAFFNETLCTGPEPQTLFRQRYKTLLQKVIHANVEDAEFSLSQTHLNSIMKCIKRYAHNDFSFGMYGKYLRKLTREKHTVFVQVTHTPLTKCCIVLCGLAGTDYNLPLPKLGSEKISTLLYTPEFEEICADIFDSEPQNWKVVRRVLTAAKIDFHSKSSASKLHRDNYLECIWRTLHYCLQTWNLQFPEPTALFGFTEDHFDCPRNITHKDFVLKHDA
nr:allo54 [Herpesvirus DDDp]